MAEKRFSELTTAGAITGAELLAMSQETLGTLLSVKSTLQNIANWFAVNSQYASALDTTDKTLCGAINELRQLISLIPQFSIEVVQTLPTEDISETTIYLVPSSDPEQGNYYEEYIYVNNTWELVGTTAVDLSAYYTKLEVDGLLSAKANTSDVTAALALKEAKADLDDDVTDILVALTDEQTTAPGNPVTLTTEQSGGAKSALVTFAPKQSGTGDPSPSNIRPFVLWDGLNLNKCDENYAQLWTIDTNFDGTVVWNQLVAVKASGYFPQNGITATQTDGLIELSGTASANYSTIFNGYKPEVGHKYLFLTKLVANPNNVPVKIGFLNAAMGGYVSVGNSIVANILSSTGSGFGIANYAVNTDLSGIKFYSNVIDLTQMFGSTIADYIYSLEQAETGSGVAFFRSMYPNDYYPYNTGTSEIVGTNIATATFPETIMGGIYDFSTGEGSATWEYIAQYNGETLPGEWMSDRDVYEEGTTPTTGAEVSYVTATPTPITLTPADVNLLKGSNTVWTDGDTVQIKYSELPNGNLGAVIDYIKQLEARIAALES